MSTKRRWAPAQWEAQARWIAGMAAAVVAISAMGVPYLWRAVQDIATGLPSPVLKMAPDSKVIIDGKVTRIWGDDMCPDRMTPHCMTLSVRDVVTAHFFDGRTEEWAIVKKGDRLSIVRPNGQYVSAADAITKPGP